MSAPKRSLIRRLVPPNFQDPVGLVRRIVRTRDPAALFAMTTTALAALATPLDLLLQIRERALYAHARPPTKPIILVTGAPRSGTTVLSQALIAHLPVTYFNNLTAVFPRAPIVANQLFGRLLRRPKPTYRSFYGRTSGFAAENDGLHLWDRWIPDRYAVPDRFDSATADAMLRFFGAYETAFGKAILNKNNALATGATLIARTLPTAHVVFVRRQAAFAVQSILGARETIQGRRDAPYGVGDPSRTARTTGPEHAIEDVCAQVLYHERKMETQRREIGGDRFRVVEYEDFCRDPGAVIARVAHEILAVDLDLDRVRTALPRLLNTNKVTVAPAEFDQIERTLERLRHATEAPFGRET